MMVHFVRRSHASANPTRARRRARWFALLAWLAVLAALVPLRSAPAADFSPDQRRAIEGIVRDYLTKNPEVMLDALEAAKEKLSKEAQDKAGAALVARKHDIFEDPASPIAGNPKGDVSLVEFFDYRCPYCKQVEPSLEALLGEDHQLRFVYKEMPVLGPSSMVAARAALAAHNQGKYDAFHRAMMGAKGQIDEATVFKVAGSVGLDADRLKRDMAAPEVDQAIKANIDLAEALDIRGTPGFVIGQEIVPGAVDLGTLKRLIAEARKK
jgi:protein-disulfide isomerase